MTLRRRAEGESVLRAGLEQRLRFCLAHPGRKHKREWKLRDGLTITLYIGDDSSRHVLLSRPAAPPSANEAQTVLNHWPEPVVGDVTWTSWDLGTFKALSAIWPAPPEQLKLENSTP